MRITSIFFSILFKSAIIQNNQTRTYRSAHINSCKPAFGKVSRSYRCAAWRICRWLVLSPYPLVEMAISAAHLDFRVHFNPLNGKNISAECFENGPSVAKWRTQMFRSRLSGNKQRATFYAGAGLRVIIEERLSATEPVLE
ncbi:hypothetical protein AVEN_205585-1 [Araneus ventricosus]|uniref:Uncharacterized protein n=1 Tax=Araneus ventricosus TaxID=182803 RepID=A0A4Y2FC39_ARAVE|nr:hypothetical protein AVEN_205585-1 [Araneus ventricosus]